MTTPESTSSRSSQTTSREPFKPNWFIMSFMIPMHLAGIILWSLYVYHYGTQWQEWAVFLFMCAVGVIGINVGYHRAYSHKSFRASRTLKWIILMAGSTTAEGSLLRWCADHRRHHRYQDTERDPYNINRGFWWAHIGWLWGTEATTDYSNCPDLSKDPAFRHQDKYYALWLIVFCFALPLAIGFLVGRPLAVFLCAGLFRLFVFNQITFLINSYAHYFGRRPYSTEITARDSLICAVIASGEGWHNFHHRFQWDYRNGHRYYHWDPAKWFIYFGQFVGLTSDLKRTSTLEIYRARIQTHKEKAAHLESMPRHKNLTEAMEGALARWEKLQLEWQRFKLDLGESSSDRMKAVRAGVRAAQKDLDVHYRKWRASLKTPASEVA